jgi:carbon starvation protein
VGEGTLALAAIIACTAGFATLGDWRTFYSTYSVNGLTAWAMGGSRIMEMGLHIPAGIAGTLRAVMGILFAATTMDAGVRLQRFIIQEFGHIYEIPALTGRGISTLVAVGTCLLLAFGAGGGGGSGGLVIWPLFGTSNQLLAGLTLMVMTALLIKLKRPILPTVIPLVFLIGMTVPALIIQLRTFWDQANYLLVVMDLLILVASILLALEALSAFGRARREAAATA